MLGGVALKCCCIWLAPSRNTIQQCCVKMSLAEWLNLSLSNTVEPNMSSERSSNSIQFPGLPRVFSINFHGLYSNSTEFRCTCSCVRSFVFACKEVNLLNRYFVMSFVMLHEGIKRLTEIFFRVSQLLLRGSISFYNYCMANWRQFSVRFPGEVV